MPPIRWDLAKIKTGFEEFHKIRGRFPYALEIDSYPLLPSSRQIQRKFGGLKELRKLLGFPENELDHSRGNTRSGLAKMIGKRGKGFEKDVYELLVNKFGEIYVHQQKPFNNYESRIDFLVYAKGYKFGIDVFYPTNMHNLVGCVNVKEKTYNNPGFEVIFLSINPELKQPQIDLFLSRRTKESYKHIKVMDLITFKNYIRDIQPLPLPPGI